MMHSPETVLVLGASTDSSRISYLAIHRLVNAGYAVVAVGRSGGEVAGIHIRETADGILPGSMDTLTLYLNAKNQEPYHSFILSLHPQRIIFNPGAENPVLESLAQREGIECENACTLVMLASGVF